MVFLPERMIANNIIAVQDSEDESDDENVDDRSAVYDIKRGGKKRNRDMTQEEVEEDEPARPVAKRRRIKAAPGKRRQMKQTEIESGDELDAAPDENKKEPRSIRRQSTMTQLVEGRRPLMDDAEEPTFRLVKRSPKLSWSRSGKAKERDKQQRTLTQMLPGIRPYEVLSEDDLEDALGDFEAIEKSSQEYDDVVAQRLAQQGLHRVESHIAHEADSNSCIEEAVQSPVDSEDHDEGKEESSSHSKTAPILMVQSFEGNMAEHEHDSYRPTMYIESPVTRTRSALRQQTNFHDDRSQVAKIWSSKSSKVGKLRFGLLSTPEKQRIREIPSSQSPAGSPLFTQISPRKMNRSPLKERSGNATNASDTPSRCRKVTFQEPTKDCNTPPTLRRFQSTVQDSEDEGGDLIEEDVQSNELVTGEHSPNSTSDIESHSNCQVVSARTQAVLEQIDQACARTNEDVAWLNRSSPEAVDGSITRLDCEEASYLSKTQQQQLNSLKDRNRSEKTQTSQRALVLKESYHMTSTQWIFLRLIQYH